MYRARRLFIGLYTYLPITLSYTLSLCLHCIRSRSYAIIEQIYRNHTVNPVAERISLPSSLKVMKRIWYHVVSIGWMNDSVGKFCPDQ